MLGTMRERGDENPKKPPLWLYPTCDRELDRRKRQICELESKRRWVMARWEIGSDLLSGARPFISLFSNFKAPTMC